MSDRVMLYIPKELKEAAKEYAKRKQVSLSSIVADFLKSIVNKNEDLNLDYEFSPKLKKMNISIKKSVGAKKLKELRKKGIDKTQYAKMRANDYEKSIS